MLTLDNPPMKYELSFEGVEANGDGLIAEADLFGLFDRVVEAYERTGRDPTRRLMRRKGRTYVLR